MDNLELVSIITVIVLITLLVLLIIIANQAILIRKILMRPYTHHNAENEAAIAKMQGDTEGHLKHLYRAMNYYWISSPLVHSPANHETLKNLLKKRYYEQITKAGGKFPDKYLPAESAKTKP